MILAKTKVSLFGFLIQANLHALDFVYINMPKSFILSVLFSVVLFSCKKDEPSTSSHNGQPLGTTQPVYDGFELDLYVYDTLGEPMEGVLVQGVDFPSNGRVCGNGMDDFTTDSVGHILYCVMYGRPYGGATQEPDSQKFALTHDGLINEITFEVLLYNTTTYNHDFEF
ncbi:MAG: hypothetical protein MK078_05475 [Crocinitomicaceae bacterium]|nr:hypothetical protein [Crocinitomicaceae bacterium]